MAENYMEIVAKLLGVELGEEFKIEHLSSFKYKIEKDGLMFLPKDSQEWIGSKLIEDLLTGSLKIVKLPKPILTNAEKRYLSNVIEPFRDRVNYIMKTENSLGEYITIYSRLYTGWRPDVLLPEFEKGAMYKGMEINKRYNLEELGL